MCMHKRTNFRTLLKDFRLLLRYSLQSNKIKMALDHLRSNEFWQKKLRLAVNALDTNNDNYISRVDFDMIISRYKEAGASPEHVRKHQESFEKLFAIWGMSDENVRLTIPEFEVMFRENLEKSFAHADELYSEWFSQVDLNDNGVISLNEWKVHSSALGISEDDAEKSYRAMDTNKDGVISMEEFIEYHKEFFFSAEDKLHSSILYGQLP